MNRFAPPSSEVDGVASSRPLGLAGWAASIAVVVYLGLMVGQGPSFLTLVNTGAYDVLLFFFVSLASLLIVVGELLLLARLPASVLCFAGALTSGLMGLIDPGVSGGQTVRTLARLHPVLSYA